MKDLHEISLKVDYTYLFRIFQWGENLKSVWTTLTPC